MLIPVCFASERDRGPDSSNEDAPPEVERDQWGGQIEFILTCVGYAVGLGNVWRFPYLTYQNGGGAFLIPYLLMLTFVGFPIFFLELSFGQFSSQGPISCWTISPLFKGVGVAMVATNWCLGLYYCIIVAWSFHFFFASFTSELPWSVCAEWSSPLCITGSQREEMLKMNSSTLNETLGQWNVSSISSLVSSSEEYFYKRVLQMSDSINDPGHIVWELALCLLLAYIIVFFVLMKGIKSLGKVVYFASLFPYAMLTILVIRGATLPGAANGVIFFLSPDMTKLADPIVWVEAATMAFYSLSACTGGLIAMSSYNNFKNNCLRDSIIVPVVTGLTSIYSGFAIFTVLGFMAYENGEDDISNVATQGPGLTFVVYPEALTKMPIAPLWAILFFVMLLSLGFSSLFSIVESVFVAIMDEFPTLLRSNPRRPIIFRGVMLFIYFLISLPMVSQNGFYIFSITDNFISGFPLLFIGMLELIIISAVYGYNRFAYDISLMLGRKPIIFFQATWVLLTPLVLGFCIIAKCVVYEDFHLADIGGHIPGWGQALGWLQVAFCLIWIPGIAIYLIVTSGGVSSIRRLAAPSPLWGPARAADRFGSVYDRELEIQEFPDRKLSNMAEQNAVPTVAEGVGLELGTCSHSYGLPLPPEPYNADIGFDTHKF